jgi:hypothetical protein
MLVAQIYRVCSPYTARHTCMNPMAARCHDERNHADHTSLGCWVDQDTQADRPGRDALMRSICPIDTDQTWKGRSAESKAMMVAREASYRLGGLSTIAYGLSFAEMAKGGRCGESVLHSEYSYFATALKELANLLTAAHKAWWDEANDLDALKSPRTRRKPKPAA